MLTSSERAAHIASRFQDPCTFIIVNKKLDNVILSVRQIVIHMHLLLMLLYLNLFQMLIIMYAFRIFAQVM